MTPIALRGGERNPQSVLLLGAHCDDIEIGCGGTVLRMTKENPELRCHWVVFSSDRERAEEAMASARHFLRHAADKTIVIKEFKNGYFPYVGGDIKDYFEQLKKEISPDLIFTHNRHDLHQDHRVIGELTWNTFRDHTILEYEIAKYDGDLGTPNLYFHLDESTCSEKVDNILEHFGSQRSRHWFTRDTFHGLMRLRGIESNAPGGYAEGFYCRKLVI